jgi:hypothetical protein
MEEERSLVTTTLVVVWRSISPRGGAHKTNPNDTLQVPYYIKLQCGTTQGVKPWSNTSLLGINGAGALEVELKNQSFNLRSFGWLTPLLNQDD